MEYNDGVIFREHAELVALHYKTFVMANNDGKLPKFPKEWSEYYKSTLHTLIQGDINLHYDERNAIKCFS